jgi:hypothetical protein
VITLVGSHKKKANVGLNKEKNAMEVIASYLYFLGLILFNFHLEFNVVQPYLHWANFTLNI